MQKNDLCSKRRVRPIRRSMGFTIIETLLTISVVGLSLGAGAYLLQSFQSSVDHDQVQSALVSMLRRAQTLSIVGAEDSSWGVRVLPQALVLFQGASFATRNQAHDELFAIPASITYAGLGEVVYQKMTGIPGATGTTTLSSGDGEERTVTVSPGGSVSFGKVFPAGLLPSEIGVLFGALQIPSASTHGQGTHFVGVERQLVYTIQNEGEGNLALDGAPLVTFNSPVNVSGLQLLVPPVSPVDPGGNTSLTIAYTPQSAGAYSFGVSIPNNDENEDPYTWTISGTAANQVPEMAVVSNVAIADGGTHAVGQQRRNVNRTITYRIDNSGTGPLALTGTPLVTVAAGTRVSLVSVSALPTTPISAGGNTTFVITYRVTGTGTFNFTVSVPNTDSNENPYNWTVSGTAAGSGGGNIGP